MLHPPPRQVKSPPFAKFWTVKPPSLVMVEEYNSYWGRSQGARKILALNANLSQDKSPPFACICKSEEL
jgi:hypothetical protein